MALSNRIIVIGKRNNVIYIYICTSCNDGDYKDIDYNWVRIDLEAEPTRETFDKLFIKNSWDRKLYFYSYLWNFSVCMSVGIFKIALKGLTTALMHLG